jgi:PIN domain nuclease of toxin-antitoxin system
LSEVVLDASAILAIIFGESGDAGALALTSRARVSAVNLSEVVAKMDERGFDPTEAEVLLGGLGMEVAKFGREDAFRAGRLRQATRRMGLSFGDRACLALALRTGLPVVTADRAWVDLGLPVEVELLR